MTAVLEVPEQAPAQVRDRLLPLVDGRGGWVLTLLVALVGGLLRFVRLDLPAGKIFDEIYYSCDALNLMRFGVEHSTQPGPGCVPTGGGAFIVHPPLGKWLIGIGERLFGDNELGWRFMAAVAGTATVLLVVRIGRRMTGSTLLGCVAGLLLSFDGLHFVQSRTSMLDVFLCLWTTAAFGCAVLDRDWVRRRLSAGPDAALGARPWLLAMGACLGAAVATKWSGVYYVLALLLLAFSWEVGARRVAGTRAPLRAALVHSSLLLLGACVLLPSVLYTLSWTGWFVSDLGYDRQWAQTHPSAHLGLLPDAFRSWVQYHQEIFRFHSTLAAKHPYQSHPLGWLALARPVSYYYPAGITAGAFGCTVASCSREVLAIGTPAIWWAGYPLLAALAYLWAKRDWRAPALMVGIAVAIFPWIRDDLRHRTMFDFYALPAVPFLCLGLALVAGWLLGGPVASARRRRGGAIAVTTYLVAVVVNFFYLYPVLAAVTIPYQSWHSRMWFSSWI